jgi:hypothetical protein
VAFTELELKRIERLVGGLCRRRTRPDVAREVRIVYDISGQSVVISEERPDRQEPGVLQRRPFAKLHLARTSGLWTLSWMPADLRWHLYRLAPPARDLAALVEAIDEDAYGAFFG